MNHTLLLPVVGGFVRGTGTAISSVNAIVTEVASTDIPILLVGESGTGKEAYARWIHLLSEGSGSALKKVNCATLTPVRFLEQMSDVVQWGHTSGGLKGGTVFLDQVNELDPQCQRLLLPLLPDNEMQKGKAGASARVISATSVDLEQEVNSGRFRRELYFRIKGVSLRLPPLRERREEIPTLLNHFLAEYAAQLKKPRREVTVDQMEALISHAWPGNIRELQNVAKMMVLLGQIDLAFPGIRPSHEIPAEVPKSGEMALKVASRTASRKTERELILKALERTRWNRKRAAQELQISYKALLYKLKHIGVQDSGSNENSKERRQ